MPQAQNGVTEKAPTIAGTPGPKIPLPGKYLPMFLGSGQLSPREEQLFERIPDGYDVRGDWAPQLKKLADGMPPFADSALWEERPDSELAIHNKWLAESPIDPLRGSRENGYSGIPIVYGTRGVALRATKPFPSRRSTISYPSHMRRHPSHLDFFADSPAVLGCVRNFANDVRSWHKQPDFKDGRFTSSGSGFPFDPSRLLVTMTPARHFGAIDPYQGGLDRETVCLEVAEFAVALAYERQKRADAAGIKAEPLSVPMIHDSNSGPNSYIHGPEKRPLAELGISAIEALAPAGTAFFTGQVAAYSQAMTPLLAKGFTFQAGPGGRIQDQATKIIDESDGSGIRGSETKTVRTGASWLASNPGDEKGMSITPYVLDHSQITDEGSSFWKDALKPSTSQSHFVSEVYAAEPHSKPTPFTTGKPRVVSMLSITCGELIRISTLVYGQPLAEVGRSCYYQSETGIADVNGEEEWKGDVHQCDFWHAYWFAALSAVIRVRVHGWPPISAFLKMAAMTGPVSNFSDFVGRSGFAVYGVEADLLTYCAYFGNPSGIGDSSKNNEEHVDAELGARLFLFGREPEFKSIAACAAIYAAMTHREDPDIEIDRRGDGTRVKRKNGSNRAKRLFAAVVNAFTIVIAPQAGRLRYNLKDANKDTWDGADIQHGAAADSLQTAVVRAVRPERGPWKPWKSLRPRAPGIGMRTRLKTIRERDPSGKMEQSLTNHITKPLMGCTTEQWVEKLAKEDDVPSGVVATKGNIALLNDASSLGRYDLKRNLSAFNPSLLATVASLRGPEEVASIMKRLQACKVPDGCDAAVALFEKFSPAYSRR